MTEERKVDWGRPIEAVHPKLGVMPATYAGRMKRGHGHKVTYDDGDGDWSWCVSEEGTTLVDKDWRIRNVAQPIAPGEPGYWEQQRQQFAKSAKILPDELTARMVALVLEIASYAGELRYSERPGHTFNLSKEARAIVAEMEPVKPLIERVVVTFSDHDMQHDVSLKQLAGLIANGAAITSLRALERGEVNHG